MSDRRKVVIVGGGFGGLSAARHLKSELVDITLIDRRNHYLFQPLLYQVATGSLSQGEIASPLRAILSRQSNAPVWLGTVQDIDPDSKCVWLSDGAVVPYDSLVLGLAQRQHSIGTTSGKSGRRPSKASRKQLRSGIRFCTLSRLLSESPTRRAGARGSLL
jgi:NADH dehydrogenase